MMTHTDATELLKSLIAIPSVSRDEKAVADFLEEQLKQQGLAPMRHHNNLWCVGRAQLSNRPTLLLNAHIDTVKPAAGWLSDPFTPQVEGERLYGLGSNDCGGGLVSLLAVFTQLESVPTFLGISFFWLRQKRRCRERTALRVSFRSCPTSTAPSLANRQACSQPLPKKD